MEGGWLTGCVGVLVVGVTGGSKWGESEFMGGIER